MALTEFVDLEIHRYLYFVINIQKVKIYIKNSEKCNYCIFFFDKHTYTYII